MSTLEEARPMHEPEDGPVGACLLLHGAIDVHQVGDDGHQLLQAPFKITKVYHEDLKDITSEAPRDGRSDQVLEITPRWQPAL